MNSRWKLWLRLLLLFVSVPSPALVKKVACVGNSITGFHQYAYYATPLQHMLGVTYKVDNFGKGGSGIFKSFREAIGDTEWAYINSTQCADALAFQPDIVIFKFGANDANNANFLRRDVDGKKVFKEEYALLINKFRDLESNPRIIIALPPAMFYPEGNVEDSLTGNFLGSFSNQAMHQYIRPAIRELSEELSVELVDFYTPTKNHPEFMPGDTGGWAPDWVHPDHRGHYLMALAAYEVISGKPFERPAVPGEFIPDLSKEYYLQNKQTDDVLGSPTNAINQNITTGPVKLGDASQLFRFENFSYNIYRIRHVASGLQVRNSGVFVQLGNNPTSDPLKYGMYIKPVGGDFHTIGFNDNNLIGARSTDVRIAGQKKLSTLSDLDQWEFVEKELMSMTSIPLISENDNVTVSSMAGKLKINVAEHQQQLKLYDITGRCVGNYEINDHGSVIVELTPGIYIIQLAGYQDKIKVIVH